MLIKKMLQNSGPKRPGKLLVHVITLLAVCCAQSQTLGSLFTSLILLLKINVPEQMVFKHGGHTSDVTWKYIELVYARGAKSEEPYL